MSEITLNTASGSITLTPTNSSGNKILTLPAVSGTVLTTASTDTANNLNAGLGVNQTWQTVTRTSGTTYYNTTGKPITAIVTQYSPSGADVTITINGLQVAYGHSSTANVGFPFTVIIPNSATYVITSSIAFTVVELR